MDATLATTDDWAAILPLVSSPQGDDWGLAHRFPQGLRATLPLERQHLAIVRHRGAIVACGLRSVRRVCWLGTPARIGYLAHLRRDPSCSPALAHRGLQAAFDCLAQTRREDELPVDLTSILDANHRARRLLEAGLPGVPTYHMRAVIRTRVWTAGTLARCADPATVRQPGPEPLHPGLVLQPDAMGAVDQGARWDLHGQAWGRLDVYPELKETMITAVPPTLRWLRPVLNVLRRAQGLPAIPRPGTVLRQRFLHCWGWQPGAAAAALNVAGSLARTLPSDHLIIAGWCDDHPDARELAAASPPAEVITARWYTVGGTLPPGSWHLEAGSL